MSTHTWKKCPNCGKTYEHYTTYTKNFTSHSGCPITTCKYCGEIFIDKDIKEPALESKPAKVSIIDCIFTMFFPFGVLSIVFAIPLIIHYTSEPWYYLFVIIPAIIWISFVIFALVKRDKINKELIEEYKASEERLKDLEYAQLLLKYKFNVPDKYLIDNQDNK